jgi:hypothetical protein
MEHRNCCTWTDLFRCGQSGIWFYGLQPQAHAYAYCHSEPDCCDICESNPDSQSDPHFETCYNTKAAPD